jgi:ribosomal protein S3AE
MAERKRFIDVEIPILEKTVQVLGAPKDLENKTIKMDLSRQLRGKGLTVTLQILNQEEKLFAYPKKFELSKSYIRRILRKRTDYVEDSFQTNTKDIKITIKPLLITRKKVSRAVRKNLRNTAREFILNYVKEQTYMELCQDILEGTLQRELLPKLKKVYPLAFCDLRVLETTEIRKMDLTMPERGVVEAEANEEESPEVEEEKTEDSKVEEEKPKAKKKAAKKVTKKTEETKEAPQEGDENANKE